MSLFWQYFKNTLRWGLIWKPGPLSAVAEGGAAVLDQVRDHELWLRRQFFPELCEAGYLGKFAMARGLQRMPHETDAAWRSRTSNAYFFWKAGGTPGGMQRVLEWFYGDVSIDETVGGWAEFGVQVGLNSESPYTKFLIDLINETKPARSRLYALDLTSQAYAPLYVAPAAKAATVNQVVGTEIDQKTVARLSGGTVGKAISFNYVSADMMDHKIAAVIVGGAPAKMVAKNIIRAADLEQRIAVTAAGAVAAKLTIII